jgi:hypothetical protein
MSKHRTALGLLIGLALVSACAAPQPTAPPRLPTVAVVLSTEVRAAAATPAPRTDSASPVQSGAPVWSGAQPGLAEVNGLQLLAFNPRLSDDRPDKDQFELDVCFQTPDAREWMFEGAALTLGGRTFTQWSASGPYKEAAPTLFNGKSHRCLTYSFAVPARPEASTFTFQVSTLRTLPTHEQTCAVVIPEAQRLLVERYRLFEIKCELTDLGYQAWVYIKPDDVSLPEAEAAFAEVRREAERVTGFRRAGEWVVNFRNVEVPRRAALTLLDPATRPPAPDLQWSAANFRRDAESLSADLCFRPPDESGWSLTEAVLEYNNVEVWPNKVEPILAPLSRQCATMTFVVPVDAGLSQALVKIYSVNQVIDLRPEGCESYLPKLQAALDARNFGIRVRCEIYAWGWDLSIAEKPEALSEPDAWRLVKNDELTSLKGFWTFPVALTP